jgi:hypothetical protein
LSKNPGAKYLKLGPFKIIKKTVSSLFWGKILGKRMFRIQG